jgi:hypothetical protein
LFLEKSFKFFVKLGIFLEKFYVLHKSVKYFSQSQVNNEKKISCLFH